MTRRLTVLGYLILLAVVAAGCQAGSNQQQVPAETPTPTTRPRPLEGDERPPIIISDGSIDLYIDRNRNAGGQRGTWDARADGTGTRLTHVPYGSPAATVRFDVYLTNALEDATPCNAPDTAIDADALEVTYGRGALKRDGTLVVTIVGGSLSVLVRDEKPADVPPVEGASRDFWRDIKGNANKLKAVALTKSGSAVGQCRFDKGGKRNRGVITIHQRPQ